MSRHEKLIRRFLSRPRDFTYGELECLLTGFGYKPVKTGKTAGSRVAFIDDCTKHIIRLHKPHPHHIVRIYQLIDIERELREKGIIK